MMEEHIKKKPGKVEKVLKEREVEGVGRTSFTVKTCIHVH